MNLEEFVSESIWISSEGEPTDSFRNVWRIIHLLGNPRLLNALARIGKPGLTFAELRFFLCNIPPKRKKIDIHLREIKKSLSEQPALDFHLPPYNTTSQLATDLRRLKEIGLLKREGEYWCLHKPQFDSLVYELEKHQDKRAIQKYHGDEVLSFGKYVRLYGVDRSLLSSEEREELESIADETLNLGARAYRIEHIAKVRAWAKARKELEDGKLPESVSNRLLNLFWYFEFGLVMSHRMHYDDTPTFVLAQMIQLKKDQLIQGRLDGTISDEAWIKANIEVMKKYTKPQARLPRSDDVREGYQVPTHLPEPPFASPKEESLFEEIVEYVWNLHIPETERTELLVRLLGHGISKKTLATLSLIRRSLTKGLTIVATTPQIPFTPDPFYFITEKAFVDRLP